MNRVDSPFTSKTGDKSVAAPNDLRTLCLVVPNRRRTERDLSTEVKTFYVYMMTNCSRVVLYIGITNSLVRRVWQHQHGEISGFTKSYKVNRLVYYESFNHPRDAISREKELKGWRRSKKSALVETLNPK